MQNVSCGDCFSFALSQKVLPMIDSVVAQRICTRVNKITELTKSDLDQCVCVLGAWGRNRTCGRCEVGMASSPCDPKWSGAERY